MKTAKILVVSPHPDDETLGAGGTLLRFKNEGHRIFWLNFTNKSPLFGYSIEETKKRKRVVEKVCKMYPFDGFFDLGLQPTAVSVLPQKEIVRKASEIIQTVKPTVVIMPYHHDIHSDHRVVFDTICSCVKSFRAPFIKEILMMEIVSETEFTVYKKGFVPNYFVDISLYMEKKIRIIKEYHEELGRHPFPRSVLNIRALATFRGATAGCQSAEGFVLFKKIM